ncbi:MAG: type I DNA topoisomerase [Candidatus Riflebacteria bacterium]|nr:type I DNA topoisomerase [Candidatus Riflebacteria bacterium]
MGKNLLIVESPGKIKTLSKFLGSDFIIEASKGHVVDLPESKIGVDVESGFTPIYQVTKNREDVIRKLREAATRVENIFLAPDPDREGEAISWHLANLLDIDPFSSCRVTFNSITKDEVINAINNPRPIDLNLVSAQQSRRILDRLVGYRLSPLLWKKVSMGLSAGRVQSVAVLFICEREREILAFNPEEYWTIKVFLQVPPKTVFETRLVKTDGRKSLVSNEETAKEIVKEIELSNPVVEQVSKRAKKSNPPPPFITSTLQQEASQRFSFTSKRTMSLAQKLYEGIELGSEGHVGLISYMRTDSVRISPEGLSEAKQFIEKRFGDSYSLKSPRVYRTKSGAQDAHEAIRPTSVWKTPEQLTKYLSNDELKLYSLIWKRFVATQMSEAIHDVLTIDISAGRHILQATGSTLVFDGFTALYTETVEENEKASDENSEAGSNEKQTLPNLEKGTSLSLSRIDPKQSFTQPPPRYSEATLIKTLEKEGIGRPSTYAAIIETIQQRGYVSKGEGRFKPSDAAFLTTTILTGAFKDIINPGFTAIMENLLDEIEEGKKDWVGVLTGFYEPFIKDLKKAEEGLKKVELHSDCVCPKCNRPMVVKLGRTGKFLACSGYPECKSTENIPEEIFLFIDTSSEQTVKLREYLDKIKERDGHGKIEPTGEKCEICGSAMVVRTGRYGKYVACEKYPECKNTKALLEAIGVKCPLPNCSGTIVVKRSKRRRVFYGCSRYPECKLTLWAKPTGETCPECSSPMVFHSTKKLGEYTKCSSKTCSFKKFPGEIEAKEESVQKDKPTNS